MARLDLSTMPPAPAPAPAPAPVRRRRRIAGILVAGAAALLATAALALVAVAKSGRDSDTPRWSTAGGLDAGAGPTTLTVTGPTITLEQDGSPSDVAFSPDGRTLVTTDGTDSTALVWDVTTGRRRAGLPQRDSAWLSGHSASVTRVVMSRDGSTVATMDGGVLVWDLASARVVARVPTTSAMDMAFSPDGRALVVGDAEDPTGGMRLVDPRTGRIVAEHRPRPPAAADGPNPGANAVSGVAFSPDGRTVAMLSNEDPPAVVRLWEVGTERTVATFSAHGERLRPRGVTFSPDGSAVAVGDEDGSARVWDVRTGRITGVFLDPRATGEVDRLAFSPDGRILAILNARDQFVRLWNVATQQKMGITWGGDMSTSQPGDVRGLAFSPDGRYLATAGGGATMLWRIEAH